MHEVTVLFFAIACGLTISGIVANIYKLVVRAAKNLPETMLHWVIMVMLHWVIMVLAGPSVLFENASQSRRDKKCSVPSYCLAIALSLYWSFAIGLFMLNIYIAV
jgi:uncharacterized protein with PQ loop repeat